MSQLYPDVTDACDRCGQSPANLVQMFWSWLKLTNFWLRIFDTLQKAYVVIGQNHPTRSFRCVSRHIMAFSTLVARCLILLNWKHVYDRWEDPYNAKLEKIKRVNKGGAVGRVQLFFRLG